MAVGAAKVHSRRVIVIDLQEEITELRELFDRDAAEGLRVLLALQRRLADPWTVTFSLSEAEKNRPC